MRTVHETEALRPSDPVPKSLQSAPSGKSSKLKIIIKTPQSHGQDDSDDLGSGDVKPEYFTQLPEESFTADELAYPVDKLYRKCFWEANWAEKAGEALMAECKEWEEIYYKEWLEKEVLLSQVIQGELDWHERRQAILSGAADVQVSGTVEKHDGEQVNGAGADDDKDGKAKSADKQVTVAEEEETS